MARNGFKIFDADTHVRPDADLLGPFLAAESRQKLGRFDKYKAKNKEGAAPVGQRSEILSAVF